MGKGATVGERKREREWESHNYSDEPHRLGEKEHKRKRKNEEERSGNLAAENLFFGLRCVSGFGAKSTNKRGLWGEVTASAITENYVGPPE